MASGEKLTFEAKMNAFGCVERKTDRQMDLAQDLRKKTEPRQIVREKWSAEV